MVIGQLFSDDVTFSDISLMGEIMSYFCKVCVSVARDGERERERERGREREREREREGGGERGGETEREMERDRVSSERNYIHV